MHLSGTFRCKIGICSPSHAPLVVMLSLFPLLIKVFPCSIYHFSSCFVDLLYLPPSLIIFSPSSSLLSHLIPTNSFSLTIPSLSCCTSLSLSHISFSLNVPFHLCTDLVQGRSITLLLRRLKTSSSVPDSSFLFLILIYIPTVSRQFCIPLFRPSGVVQLPQWRHLTLISAGGPEVFIEPPWHGIYPFSAICDLACCVV